MVIVGGLRKLCVASWLMLPVIITVSFCGLLLPWAYGAEAFVWRQQAIGQDLLNLCMVCPFLLLSTIGVWRKNKVALAWWTGINIYFAYTFAIYCFAIHFNALFLLYCMVFGLSFYSAIAGVVVTFSHYSLRSGNNKWTRITAGFFLVISTVFCSLWLLDIFSGLLANKRPETLAASGLVTNPVQVLDLSIILPGICITSILALTKKNFAVALQPAILVFIMFMDMTIAFLNFYLTRTTNPVGIGMLLLAAITFYLLSRTKFNVTSQ